MCTGFVWLWMESNCGRQWTVGCHDTRWIWLGDEFFAWGSRSFLVRLFVAGCGSRRPKECVAFIFKDLKALKMKARPSFGKLGSTCQMMHRHHIPDDRVPKKSQPWTSTEGLCCIHLITRLHITEPTTAQPLPAFYFFSLLTSKYSPRAPWSRTCIRNVAQS